MGLSPHFEAATANHPRDGIAQVNPTVFDDFRMRPADWQNKKSDQGMQVALLEDGTFDIPPLETEMPILTAMKGGGANKDMSKSDNSQSGTCNLYDYDSANWISQVNDGDTYLVDRYGNVHVYIYADRTGMKQDAFQVTRRGAGCEAIEFTQNGKTWIQVENDKWIYVTSDRQVSPRSYEFEFSMDENGVHARGKDSHFLNIPGQSFA